MKNISIIILVALSILCVSAAGTSFEQRQWKKTVTESQMAAMDNFNDAVYFYNDHNLGMASSYLGLAERNFDAALSRCNTLPGAAPDEIVNAAKKALVAGQEGARTMQSLLYSDSDAQIEKAIGDVQKADKDFWKAVGKV